jgi:homoserine O-acetyltransferase/O-succinyltransferase
MNKGITTTTLETDFITESGFRFEKAPVAYKTWGELNVDKDNVILIFHALTGHAAADEWFPGIFGEGNICDPDEHFIICVNVPGSCYGSVGPQSINPKNGKAYRNDFPEITIRDMVRFQQHLLDQLGITGIELVIGGSMGGMQALEFIFMDRRARSAVLIAMGKAHTPWAIGISHAQRTAIQNDPKWKNGNYQPEDGPFRGVATARMMAMVTYRAPEDYNRKFGRKLQNEDGQFQIESYLNYQGQKLAKRMDAHTYITLTKAMDSHDISRNRSDFELILNRIEIPIQVIGITSDHLYPVAEQKELANLLPNGRYAEIDSPAGHDGFLIEFDQLNSIIKPFTHRIELLIY